MTTPRAIATLRALTIALSWSLYPTLSGPVPPSTQRSPHTWQQMRRGWSVQLESSLTNTRLRLCVCMSSTPMWRERTTIEDTGVIVLTGTVVASTPPFCSAEFQRQVLPRYSSQTPNAGIDSGNLALRPRKLIPTRRLFGWHVNHVRRRKQTLPPSKWETIEEAFDWRLTTQGQRTVENSPCRGILSLGRQQTLQLLAPLP